MSQLAESTRRIIDRLSPSLVPLTIICGPVAAGKSTWVRERAAGSDLVIDLDVIESRLSGLPPYHADRRWLAPALAERDRLLLSLSSSESSSLGHAWLIVSAPAADDRALWHERLSAESVVVLETPAAICKQRLLADRRRPGHVIRAQLPTIDAWWRAYVRRVDDVVERTAEALIAPPASRFLIV